MKGIANERLDFAARWENIAAMKDWFKKILRMNKDKAISVRACTDTILLNVLNCKKGFLPPEGEMLTRLHAIKHGLDDEFPELPSPASVCSSTPSVSHVAKPLYYSQVVKGMTVTPERTASARAASAPQPQVVELEQPVAAGTAHAGGESSSLQGDVTSNPLITSIYEFMSGLSTKFNDMEKTVAYVLQKVDGEEGAASAPHRPSSPEEEDEDETDRSPARPSTSGMSRKRSAPSPKKFKGLKSIADSRKAFKRGKVVPPCFVTPPKGARKEQCVASAT